MLERSIQGHQRLRRIASEPLRPILDPGDSVLRQRRVEPDVVPGGRPFSGSGGVFDKDKN
jgi:hypothetical protein